jgi:CheY-like chemotaxis protein
VGGPLYQRIELSQQWVSDVLPPPEFIIESYLTRVQLRFSVSDTGIGLTSTQIARLVGVESVYGKGSTFWFSARLEVGSEEKIITLPSIDLHGSRVLVVDDNDINQLVASEMLRNVGMQVDIAENGQFAVKLVAARIAEGVPYDMVLMDRQMPVMDGVTAARHIRQDHGAYLPIVAMTANAMKADRDRCHRTHLPQPLPGWPPSKTCWPKAMPMLPNCGKPTRPC